MPIERSMIVGAVLAGGQSRRMGLDKAFAPLDGRPMLSVVVDRLRPQVGRVIIGAGGDPARLAEFGCPCVPDPQDFLGMGPAAGVLAGLRYARENGFGLVATAPCDAPFAPSDWLARLVDAMRPGIDVCVVESDHGVEAAFALWRIEMARAVETALKADERSLRNVIRGMRAARVRFEPGGDVDAFWNLNRPEDLALANAWLRRRRAAIRQAGPAKPARRRSHRITIPREGDYS